MPLPERLQELKNQFYQQSEEFKRVSAEFDEQLRESQENYPPMTDDQREQLEEHYRSGKAGDDLRDLQRMVDNGEVTWDEIERGTADPELTERYYRSLGQGQVGVYVQAAAEGRDIDDYLPEEEPAEDPDEQDNSQGSWLV